SATPAENAATVRPLRARCRRAAAARARRLLRPGAVRRGARRYAWTLAGTDVAPDHPCPEGGDDGPGVPRPCPCPGGPPLAPAAAARARRRRLRPGRGDLSHRPVGRGHHHPPGGAPHLADLETVPLSAAAGAGAMRAAAARPSRISRVTTAMPAARASGVRAQRDGAGSRSRLRAPPPASAFCIRLPPLPGAPG